MLNKLFRFAMSSSVIKETDFYNNKITGLDNEAFIWIFHFSQLYINFLLDSKSFCGQLYK